MVFHLSKVDSEIIVNLCTQVCYFIFLFLLVMNVCTFRVTFCCGASEPEASERSSNLICAERGF